MAFWSWASTREGFRALGLPNPAKMQADLASMCRDDLQPPLQPSISVEDVDGVAVVLAQVAELSRGEKPCYVRAKGLERGSYVRVGDSDRRLTSEEVQQLVADRGQPSFDMAVLVDASLVDLDGDAAAAYVLRLRASKSRIFGDETDSTILRMTKVTALRADGTEGVTLAGLLSLGRYPQQFLPQLNLTFVHLPTRSGEATSSGVRFLDNISVEGSIPATRRQSGPSPGTGFVQTGGGSSSTCSLFVAS